MRAPTIKSASAAKMTRRRPRASANTEAAGEATSAKRAVDDVMMDLSNDVKSRPERAVPIETRVAEMTPVSSL